MDNGLKIINYLGKHIGQSFTMHELSKIIDVPYATFYRAIQKMNCIVKIQKIGKSKAISLNKDNYIIKSYLTISSEDEKKEFLQKNSMISKISSELNTNDIVVLFGSFAKGLEREDSDIDLLIINRTGEKSISFSRYEFLFKKKINPIFIKKIEFKKMLKEKDENVGKQALKNHIILNNPESFWEVILHG